MIALELTGEVGSDHRLTVEVPLSCPPGRHRILLFVEQPEEQASVTDELTKSDLESLEWRDGVLVFTGELLDPNRDMVAEDRESRMRTLWGLDVS
jgi:hypothetical protein